MDLIEIQEALDILDDLQIAHEQGMDGAYADYRKQMCELPSAQPEIIRCKDCRFWQDKEEGVVEASICARPENRHEKHPFRFLAGKDDYCSFAERREDAETI